MVIRAKNPVHSVLFFILILLGLDFFAMIFLVVYVGVIAVLLLFIIMILNVKIAEIYKNVLCYLLMGNTIGCYQIASNNISLIKICI